MSSKHGGKSTASKSVPDAQAALGPEGPLPERGVTREYLRDLAALLALPRMWRGLEPRLIVSSLLDVLVSLLRLDAAYVHIADTSDGTALEEGRPSRAADGLSWHDAIPAGHSAGDGGSIPVRNPAGEGSLRMVRFVAYVESLQADVYVGAGRAGFPTEFESFVCRLAAEQAMLAVQTSRLLVSLRSANAAKATFLATMSHELRTPLNAIVGYSALLQAGIGGDLQDQHKAHVSRIQSAARHLIEIIEGILSFARVEAGREKIQASRISVADLLADVVSLMEPLAQAKGLPIHSAIAEPDLEMTSDSAKIRQIMLNLISNAVKFTQSGSISVDVGRTGDDVVWRVRDTGIGIAPEDRERIFEPFRQVSETHTDRAPGTGLGLSVSRQLARLLGGDVTVESSGGGSTFSVRLPVTAPSDVISVPKGRDRGSSGESAKHSPRRAEPR